MPYLMKEEPSNYNYDAFVKDGGTTWTGVKNPVAQRNLRSMKRGDLVFFYHTGDEKQIVGIAKATSDPYRDPANKAFHCIDIAPVKKLKRPVTLAEVKADKRFATHPLARVPRLSVMPFSDEEWAAILAMSERA